MCVPMAGLLPGILTSDMKRREFITLFGGAAAAWPLAVRAQQPERMRRIGVLIPLAADDPEAKARLAAFQQGLQQLGWTEGSNMRIDARWSAGNAEEIRKFAAELVALTPDVILASGGTVVGPLLQVTRTVPIVFTQTPDPVGAGYVESLARPGGNATGFTLFEYGMGGEVAGAAQTDRAERDASGDPSRSRHTTRDRTVGCHPDSGTIVRDRGEPDQYKPRRRVRACPNGRRARSEQRPDRDRQLVGGGSSKVDCHAGGQAQAAGGLLDPLARRRRRPDLLWC
jgi:ABC transporter substrate binding protein